MSINMPDDHNTPSMKKPFSLEKDIKNFSSDSAKVTPEDRRQAFKNYIAGTLALILWSSLSGVIAWHIISVNSIIKEYGNTTSENLVTEKSKLDTSSSLVNDTAKTIYSFLGTLTAAVSGFYFTSLSSSSSNNNQD